MPEPHPAFRLGRGEWLTLAAIAALGLVTIPQPFAWDQAMFTIGARKLAAGAVLYRDYWDPKQPAMFAFYWLAGVLFGFHEVGIHTFELIYMLIFAATLMAVVGSRYGRGIGRVAALLSVGLFFAVCSDGLHAQIECVVGLPLLIALAAAVRAGEDPGHAARWLVVSGIAGSVVLLFKLILLPILAGIWLVALVDAAAGGVAALAIAALAILCGVALPVGACTAYFAMNGALELARWTSFVYPVAVLREAHEPRIRTLILSARWFALHWAPVAGAALVGLARARGLFEDRFALGLVIWILTGALVLLIQRLSYWPYHFLIFMVPLGCFAALGLAFLARVLAARLPAAAPRRAIAVALALVAFLPSLGPWSAQALALARDGFALSPGSLRRHLDRVNPGGVYPKVRAEVAFLNQPGARPGPIWVVGNPLYYWLSGRDQAVPRNGGSFIEYASADEWRSITASLAAARPAYIYIHDEYGMFLPGQHIRTGSFLTFLATEYEPVSRTVRGTWFGRREDLPTAEARP